MTDKEKLFEQFLKEYLENVQRKLPTSYRAMQLKAGGNLAKLVYDFETRFLKEPFMDAIDETIKSLLKFHDHKMKMSDKYWKNREKQMKEDFRGKLNEFNRELMKLKKDYDDTIQVSKNLKKACDEYEDKIQNKINMKKQVCSECKHSFSGTINHNRKCLNKNGLLYNFSMELQNNYIGDLHEEPNCKEFKLRKIRKLGGEKNGNIR